MQSEFAGGQIPKAFPSSQNFSALTPVSEKAQRDRTRLVLLYPTVCGDPILSTACGDLMVDHLVGSRGQSRGVSDLPLTSRIVGVRAMMSQF